MHSSRSFSGQTSSLSKRCNTDAKLSNQRAGKAFSSFQSQPSRPPDMHIFAWTTIQRLAKTHPHRSPRFTPPKERQPCFANNRSTSAWVDDMFCGFFFHNKKVQEALKTKVRDRPYPPMWMRANIDKFKGFLPDQLLWNQLPCPIVPVLACHCSRYVEQNHPCCNPSQPRWFYQQRGFSRRRFVTGSRYRLFHNHSMPTRERMSYENAK